MIAIFQDIRKNAIINNSVYLGLSGGLRVLADVALVILAVRALDPAAAGQVIIAFTVIRVAQHVAEGGLAKYLVREIPREPGKAGTYTVEAIQLVAIFTIPIGLLVSGGAAFAHPGLAGLFAIGATAVLFGSMTSVLDGAFLARHRPNLGFIAMSAQATVQLTGLLVAVTLTPSLTSFLVVISLSRLAGCGIALIAFWMKVMPDVTLGELSARRALVRAFPYSLNAIGSYVYLRLDILLLGAIAGSISAGVYGSVAGPLVSLTAAAHVLSSAFLPSMSRAWGNHPARFAQLAKKMMLVDICGGAVVAAAIFFGAGRIVSIAFGNDVTPDAADILRVLSIVVFLRFFNNGLATWLTASGRQWDRTKAIMSVAGLNLVLNLAAIPVWGYWAAVWSTIACEAVLSVVVLSLLRSELSEMLADWKRPASVVSLPGEHNASHS